VTDIEIVLRGAVQIAAHFSPVLLLLAGCIVKEGA
jgi:hypothetical protein